MPREKAVVLYDPDDEFAEPVKLSKVARERREYMIRTFTEALDDALLRAGQKGLRTPLRFDTTLKVCFARQNESQISTHWDFTKPNGGIEEG